MPSPVFIDTVFVIALISHRDQYHNQAAVLAKQFENQPLLVTDAVLFEIGNALARHYKQEAVAIIEEFVAAAEVDIVHLTPALFEQAFDLYKTHQDKQWGLVDCLSFVVMQEQGIHQALTFDQHFTQAGFVALMRNLPQP